MLLSNRPRILTVVLILIVLGSVGVWQSPLFNEPPPPVTIEEATAQLQQNNSQSTQIITNPLATETPVVMQAENNTNDIDPQGEWIISMTDTSFAGYRIGEELLNVGTTTAVGRTNLISGFLMFDGNSILNTYIEVDLTTLEFRTGVGLPKRRLLREWLIFSRERLRLRTGQRDLWEE